jgi:hypothetical protein
MTATVTVTIVIGVCFISNDRKDKIHDGTEYYMMYVGDHLSMFSEQTCNLKGNGEMVVEMMTRHY